MRARDASLDTIEALFADRLRHILVELLPSPRRVVYVLCACVTSLNDCRQHERKTCTTCNVYLNQNRVTSGIDSSKYHFHIHGFIIYHNNNAFWANTSSSAKTYYSSLPTLPNRQDEAFFAVRMSRC